MSTFFSPWVARIMTIVLTAACWPLVLESSAQSLAGSVIGSSGGVSVAGGVCLSFTVGETVIQGGTAGTIALTTGFQQPSSYDHWSAARGLTAGPLVDSDGDGVVNLLEYAFGTNPLSRTSRALPAVSIGPGGKLYITMPKGTPAGDLVWSAEVSKNLQSWTTQGVTIALNDSTTFSALYTGSAPAFLRLRISIPGPK